MAKLRHSRRFGVASAVAVGSVLFLLAFAAPSGAASRATHATRSGHVSGMVLAHGAHSAPKGQANGDPPLLYHGGKVMQKGSKTYAIFWEPSTLQNGNPTSVSPTYNSLLQQYFNDVGGHDLYQTTTQYFQRAGAQVQFIKNRSKLSGTYVDTSAYPASGCSDPATPGACVSDAQIQAEVTKVLGIKGWVADQYSEFFVFTSKGEGSCFSSFCAFSYYCAYHGSYTAGGKKVIYANMPYAGTDLSSCSTLSSNSQAPNGDVDADSTINVTSHEHMEAVTDPYGDAWYDAIGYENGDECAWLFPSPLPLDNGKATVQWNGHFYYVQGEWSNQANDCIF